MLMHASDHEVGQAGGWVGAVKSDITRPHASVAKFPPYDLWETAKIDKEAPNPAFDPLGLTPEQRAVSDACEEFGSMLGPSVASAVMGGVVYERACGYCRRYGHREWVCPSVIPGEWWTT